jgi:hypothetical protein
MYFSYIKRCCHEGCQERLLPANTPSTTHELHVEAVPVPVPVPVPAASYQHRGQVHPKGSAAIIPVVSVVLFDRIRIEAN